MPDHKSRVEEYGDDLATMDEARKATISKERIGDVKDFWPGFAAAVGKKESTKHVRIGARPTLQWALGAVGLVVVLGVSVLVPKLFHRSGPSAAPGKTAVIFRIDSVKIDDEPAQAFIFQTQDQGSTFVWVEKQL
jgi:hypothetical protein